MVLLDGFYGDSSAWTTWLSSSADATLRLISKDTIRNAEAWLRSLPEALRDQVKLEPAKCSHNEILTNGEWLPRVLGESSLAEKRGSS